MAEISASQYGQQRGISKQRVSQAIKNGKLSKCLKRDDKGEIWRDPKTGGFLLDESIADLEWSQNVGLHPNAKSVRDAEDEPPQPSAEKYAQAPTSPKPPGLAGQKKYMENRTTREQYLAEMARLDYEERIGQLVAADEVTAMLEKIVTETKTRILAVPGKAKALIPHLKTDDVLMIDSLLRDALTELADARPVA